MRALAKHGIHKQEPISGISSDPVVVMPNATTVVMPYPIPSRAKERGRNLTLSTTTNHTQTGRLRIYPTPFSFLVGTDGAIQGFLQDLRVRGMLAKDEGEPSRG